MVLHRRLELALVFQDLARDGIDQRATIESVLADAVRHNSGGGVPEVQPCFLRSNAHGFFVPPFPISQKCIMPLDLCFKRRTYDSKSLRYDFNSR
jgi:hypothetical protein